MGGKKGGSSVQVAQYIPGYEDLLNTFIGQLPGLMGETQDFSQPMSVAEQILSGTLGNIANTGFTMPADSLIQGMMLNTAGIPLSTLTGGMTPTNALDYMTAKEPTTIVPSAANYSSSMDSIGNMLSASDPELASMYSTYKNAYDSKKAMEDQALKDNIRSFQSDIAAKGRIGSGAHVVGNLNRARSSMGDMSNYGATLSSDLVNKMRELTSYRTGLQSDILGGLAGAYGTTGMANLLTTAQTLGAVPQQLEASTREASINDLLYRLGLGTRVAGGLGTGARSATSTETGGSAIDIGKLASSALTPIFSGMYNNPNIFG